MKVKTNVRAGQGGVDSSTSVDTSVSSQNQNGKATGGGATGGGGGGGGGGGKTVVIYYGRCVGI